MRTVDVINVCRTNFVLDSPKLIITLIFPDHRDILENEVTGCFLRDFFEAFPCVFLK